jgi:hypothetical protein
MEETNATPSTPSKANKYQNLDDYLRGATTALTNAADTEIAPLLSDRSYTKSVIDQKIAQLEDLKELVKIQTKEYGDQYQATKNYNEAVAVLHPKYMEHLLISRIIFKDNVAAKTTLGLNGTRKRSASSYCRQAELFYKGATENADYKAALSQKGITDTALQTGKTGYANLSDLAANQVKETGEAQGATAARDQAIDDFAAWFSEFKAIGKIALSAKPQLREKLGWKE